MAECVVHDWQGEQAGQATLELKVASEETAAYVVHRALRRQLANARQGTASSKTRAEVRGGGRKPWRQKGTGRARAGSNTSPLWRGGGVIFGPKPRDYSQKMNRKERRLAIRTAVQSRLADVVVVQEFVEQLPRPKTKEVMQALGRWQIEPDAKVLLILPEPQESVYLSVRNVATIRLITANNLNIFDVLNAEKIVITEAALEKVQEVYGGD